jgi:2-polyprenyl-3-methyl-5-hydroxy-6-metoxy-1,4-benzoquinol methylase
VSFDFGAAYDELNADQSDYRFYTDLALALDVHRAVDLGCGTGTLALMMAAEGITVTGVDPDPDMLRVARTKPQLGSVTWLEGDSSRVEPRSADFTVMSGHVAQIFVDDDSWRRVLTHLREALDPHGTLAFETRNPLAKGWEAWNREATLRTVMTDDGPVEFWHEVAAVDLPHVTYVTWTRNLVTGDEACNRDTLAFRSADDLRDSLEQAEFHVTDMFGNWTRSPFSRESKEIIVTATCSSGAQRQSPRASS